MLAFFFISLLCLDAAVDIEQEDGEYWSMGALRVWGFRRRTKPLDFFSCW
jgi:hypothetical protein